MFKKLIASAAVLFLMVALIPTPAQATPPSMRAFDVWYKAFPNGAPQLAGTYTDLNRAQREVQNLRSHGYNAWVVTRNNPCNPPIGGEYQVWMRYRAMGPAHLAGDFRSRSEADREVQMLRNHGYSAWVRAL
jgi:hypothetical protein